VEGGLAGEEFQRIRATDIAELDSRFELDDAGCSGTQTVSETPANVQRKSDNSLDLELGNVRLAVSPSRGGGIERFAWRGHDVFRPFEGGDQPTDLSCFPLVPFCNRITNRRLHFGSEDHLLPPAPQDIEPRHALHGIGWTCDWSVTESSSAATTLSLKHDGTQWPWKFVAGQEIVLNETGYIHRLSLTNTDARLMPAGLGLHPYFPNAEAKLQLGASGFWATGANLLPTHHAALTNQPNWFDGKNYDHCFTGRANPILLEWPTHRLRIHTSANLPYTHVFVPDGADFFCVEPVSHIPDAVNSTLSAEATGLRILEPGETMEVECRFELESIA
jgi:aldose 1-epimerase